MTPLSSGSHLYRTTNLSGCSVRAGWAMAIFAAGLSCLDFVFQLPAGPRNTIEQPPARLKAPPLILSEAPGAPGHPGKTGAQRACRFLAGVREGISQPAFTM